MRRLREHQLVTIEVGRPNASIDCLVIAIERDEATLEPVTADEVNLLSGEGRDALLTFQYRSQLITLRGSARQESSGKGLLFAVTDRVTVPQRRRYARVAVALPLTVTALPAAAGADPIETRTRDVSADGLLAEEQLPEGDRWQVVVQVPDDGPPISAEALFVRHVGGGTALRFAAISAEDRERLKEFVAARKRAILRQVRARGR
jgi:PilZ domain-containing protein